ncbi:MAG: hypothetical protein J5711_10205 [Bacteroidales bacterium]|nr:hypothetical protein [Bacteroidales bacterium]
MALLLCASTANAQRKELPEEWDMSHMVMWGVGASVAPQWSFGITYGQVRILGWYVSAYTGTGYHFNGDYELNRSNRPIGDYPLQEDYFNGRTSKARFSITGGMLFRTVKPLWFYVGTGYSYRSVVYNTQGGYWLKSQANSYSSVAIEGGLIYNFRRVVISAGFSTIGFSYIDGRLGVGFTF